MSNLSILQRNIIHALDCDVAEREFLRACDRVPVLSAEEYALEVRDVVAIARIAKAQDDLIKFICDRHYNMRFSKKG